METRGLFFSADSTSHIMEVCIMTNQKLALFCSVRAYHYASKDGFDNLMKGLKWLKRSLYFADPETRQYVVNKLKEVVEKHT